jgi:NitT/TauT family transport system substrate-binding protein
VRTRNLRSISTAVVVALLAVGCGSDGGTDPAAEDEAGAVTDDTGDDGDDGDDGGDASGELTPVRFAPTAPLPAYWPYFYIAEPLGFYEDEGIDIEFINAQAAVQQALMSNRLDVAGTGLDYIVQAPTFDDPPQWYMNVDRYLWVMVTFADSDVDEIADLRGRRIGINAPHDSLDADFMMGSAGVPVGEYELIPVGEDLQAVVALERGEIDAFVTAGAVSKVAIDEFSEREVKIISSPDTEEYFNIGAMFTVEGLEADRDLAVRFGRAVAKGMIWTFENPQVAGELLMEVAPDAAEDVDQAVRFVEAGNMMNQASYEARGAMDLDIYQRMVDVHAELGLIDESYDASILFTNDLIDEIWDFDVDAEVERARAGEY